MLCSSYTITTYLIFTSHYFWHLLRIQYLLSSCLLVVVRAMKLDVGFPPWQWLTNFFHLCQYSTVWLSPALFGTVRCFSITVGAGFWASQSLKTDTTHFCQQVALISIKLFSSQHKNLEEEEDDLNTTRTTWSVVKHSPQSVAFHQMPKRRQQAVRPNIQKKYRRASKDIKQYKADDRTQSRRHLRVG